MNILIDRLPESVEIGGARYPICTGFRTSILFELMARDREIPDDFKIEGLLRLYYENIPPDEDEAIKKALWFYNCGKEIKKKDERNRTSAAFRKNTVLYSFEQDAPYIYAAFKSEYGIDLQDIEDMHWWKFSAMFDGLPDIHKIKKIMEIRGMSTDGMSSKQVRRINELKKHYELEDKTSVDGSVCLAKRNIRMKEYVRRRMQEVEQNAWK